MYAAQWGISSKIMIYFDQKSLIPAKIMVSIKVNWCWCACVMRSRVYRIGCQGIGFVVATLIASIVNFLGAT